jgi:nicotinate-nucleotide adenylyltransferase
MGSDNLEGFHKWKNNETILENYDIYVYPRLPMGTVDPKLKNHPKIHWVDAPIMEISSTFIRKQHKAGKNVRALLPESVWKYMDEMNFYR